MIPLWLLGFLKGMWSFVGSLVTFFTTKPGVYVGIALIVAGAEWYVIHTAYMNGIETQKRIDKALEDAAILATWKAAKAHQAQLDEGIRQAAENAAYLRGKAQAETITIIKKVPVYVTKETDDRFPVPCGLYRILRAAETGPGTDPSSVSLPSGLTDGDACPLTASDVASNGAEVAGYYYGAVAQIKGLQDLAKALAAQITKENGTDGPDNH